MKPTPHINDVCLHILSSDHHHSYKINIVDDPSPVRVGLPDHLINLIIGELLTQVGHDVSEFRGGDGAVALSVEHPESFDDLLLRVGVLHLPESWRMYLPISERNSGKSMVPFDWESTSLIMSCSSASVGF